MMNGIVKIGSESPARAVMRCVGPARRHGFLAATLAAVLLLFGNTAAHAQGDITNVITDTVTRNVTDNIGRNLEANLVKPTLSPSIRKYSDVFRK